MSQIDLVINDKLVVIKKLPLKKYADLLAAFKELPQHFDLFEGKSTDEIVQNLPIIITTAYPDAVRIIQIATDMNEEDIEAMGLDDLVQIIEALMKVNNYSSVYSAIKKMMAQMKEKGAENKQPTTLGSGSGGQ
jgi:hypothetical protein